MSEKLAETLRQIRGVKGLTIREVEHATGISNAYLSQLESGKAANPSPRVLHTLATFYDVPYESLMEAAGYLQRNPAKYDRRKRPGAIEAALLSAELNPEEQVKVAEFIEFLRSQRRQKRKS